MYNFRKLEKCLIIEIFMHKLLVLDTLHKKENDFEKNNQKKEYKAKKCK